MKENYLQLETLSCPSCGIKIEHTVKKIEGVEEVTVLFNTSKVKVIGDVELELVKNVIEKLGYPVLEINNMPVEKEPKKSFFDRLRRR